MQAKVKQKKCRVCKGMFAPFKTTQVVCNDITCAITYGKKLNEKAKLRKHLEEKKEIRAQKEKLKTRSQWLKEAQASFNAFIRERDKDKPCISCGRHHEGQYHAGHYLTVGANPELRFHPFNNNKQCSPCNNHLSGNIVKYRPRLIEKIGTKNLEWLEGPHKLQKLTIDDIKEIKAHYKEQLKFLKAHNTFFNWQNGLVD